MITHSSRFPIAAALAGALAFAAQFHGRDIAPTRRSVAAQKLCADRQMAGTRIEEKYRSCVQGATDQALAQVRWPPNPMMAVRPPRQSLWCGAGS